MKRNNRFLFIGLRNSLRSVSVLLHHHLARSAVVVAHNGGTAVCAVEFLAAQVVEVGDAGFVLAQLNIVNTALQGHNVITVPR